MMQRKIMSRYNMSDAFSPAARLNCVVALPAEAKPVITALQLKRIRDCHPWACYRNDSGTIYLIISGVGNLNSAMAVSYLQRYQTIPEASCYLNIGIAGGDGELGQALAVDKIIAEQTGQAWYLQVNHHVDLPWRTCLTVSQPQTHYPQDCVVDMEAAGFINAAVRYVTKEQIQLIKIISDNDASGHDEISAPNTRHWVTEQLPAILASCQQLLTLSSTQVIYHQPPQHYAEYLANWHFSFYQSGQLRQLLRQLAVYDVDTDWQLLSSARNARQVLAHLQNQLYAQLGGWL